MAATQPTLGMHHLTVVPVNFEPADEETEDGPKEQ